MPDFGFGGRRLSKRAIESTIGIGSETSLQDRRGGGTGGILLPPDSGRDVAVKDQEQRGAWSVQRSAEASRYILAASSCAPSFFSVCFFLAILRQRSQGCFPSNVLLIPTSTPSDSEYLTSIPTQAVACKTAQCPPISWKAAMRHKKAANLDFMGELSVSVVGCQCQLSVSVVSGKAE